MGIDIGINVVFCAVKGILLFIHLMTSYPSSLYSFNDELLE